MDIQMPVLDGIAATREIRAGDGAGAHVPIIALTAHATKEDALVCLEAGMDGYVAKPVDAAELLDALKRVLDDGPAT